MDQLPDKDGVFSIKKRLMSFVHASRGIWLFAKHTHNAWLHAVAFVIVISLGAYFNISRMEWIALFIVCGLVFVSEAFNSAIEVDIDLTSPEYHPYARDTKDIAAGAVLLSAIFAIIVGVLIFWPHIVKI